MSQLADVSVVEGKSFPLGATRRACIVGAMEQEQIDRRGVLGIDAEIDALCLACGSERKALTFHDTNIPRLAHPFIAATVFAALPGE